MPPPSRRVRGQVPDHLAKTGHTMKTNLIIGVLAMAAVVVASNILVQHLLGDWLTWGALTYPIAFLVVPL